MVITLHIPPELEGSLQTVAEQSGVEPARWASEVITDLLKQTADTFLDQTKVESDRLRQLFRRRQGSLRSLTPQLFPPQTGEEAMLHQLIADKLRKQGVTGGPRS